MAKKTQGTESANPKNGRRIVAPAPVWAPFMPTRGLWILLAAAFLMRFPDLGSKSLWVDEIFDWNVVNGPWSGVWRTVHQTNYALTKLAMNFGQSEFFLRLPSAAFGLVGVLFMYLTGRMIRDERLGLLAGAAFCVSPIFVYYTQDSHHYGIMMGLATVVMFSVCWMTQRDSWFGAGLLLVSSYLTYKVHLAAIFVPLSALGALGVWILFDRTLLDQATGWMREKGRESPTVVWGAAIGVALAAAIVVARLARLASRAMGEDTASELETTPNFALDWGFFSKLFRDYLGGFSDYSRLNLGVSLFVAALAAAGFAVLVYRRHWLALFLALLFVSPWIALSIRASEHFFHIRYTSFIVPGLLLLACVALDGLARLWERPAGEGERAAPRGGTAPAYWAVLGAAAAIWSTAVVPNLWRYYRGEKQDWRGAAEKLAKIAEPDARIATLLYCNHTSLEFYEARLGHKPLNTYKLYEKTGGSGIPLNQLKNICLEGKPVYVTSSYQRYEPEALYGWVRKSFDRVFNSPTLHPDEFNREGKNVEVHKFRYSGRYLKPPEPLAMTLDGERGEWKEEILVDQAFEARVRVGWTNETDAPVSAAMLAGGKELKRWHAQAKGQGVADFVAEIPAGPVEFQLLTQGQGAAKFKTVSFEAAFRKPARISALAADTFFPSYFNKEVNVDGRRVISMQRNSFMGYEIVLPPGRDRYLAVEGRHDAPGPVLLEVAVDGVGQGILSFVHGDNSWSVEGMPFAAGEGRHRIDICFVNEGDIEKNAPDEDRDAMINWLEIYGAAQEGRPDGRAPIENPMLLDPGDEKRMDWSGEEIPKGWYCTDLERLEFIRDPWAAEGAPGNVARILCERPADPANDAFFLNPLPLPVRPGQLVYFSTEVRTEKLVNHSVNMALSWLDDDGKSIKKSTIYQQGLTDAQFFFPDRGWTRMVAIRPAPPGASKVSCAIWIYPNGRLTSSEPGHVYVRPFRFYKPE